MAQPDQVRWGSSPHRASRRFSRRSEVALLGCCETDPSPPAAMSDLDASEREVNQGPQQIRQSIRPSRPSIFHSTTTNTRGITQPVRLQDPSTIMSRTVVEPERNIHTIEIIREPNEEQSEFTAEFDTVSNRSRTPAESENYSLLNTTVAFRYEHDEDEVTRGDKKELSRMLHTKEEISLTLERQIGYKGAAHQPTLCMSAAGDAIATVVYVIQILNC
eukprot:GHVT01011584.1.p1 GENE.GHVT01011584.1~~GHVT01011584.1.p1  ORF type:complete len:218 (+),score=23.66 GHVT01011584.1:657-1310(+)